MADITITITIDDAHVQRALDAICAIYDYDQGKLDGETKGQFANRMVAQWVKDTTMRHEAAVAKKAAGDAVEEIDATSTSCSKLSWGTLTG